MQKSPDPQIDALQWACAHPSYFFPNGVAGSTSLMEQLEAGARTLGAIDVETRRVGSWFVIAARNDWFSRARLPIPEDFRFRALTPFPELGQNCVRPECIVAAFAKEAVVLGPAGAHVVKGSVAQDDPIFIYIAEAVDWMRAIAFRGVDV